MQTVNSVCHEFCVLFSFVACIAGLVLLWGKTKFTSEAEETEEILLRMSFAYWLVYCVAFGVKKIILPDWETVMLSLKITSALSYLLTFSCILSLPLHKFAVHRVQE